MILKLSQQKRPKKPEGAVQLGLTNPIWETVETCWKTRPSDRLRVNQVLEIWEKEINGAPAEQTLNGSGGDKKSAFFLHLSLPQINGFGSRWKNPLVEIHVWWIRAAV